MGYVQRGLCILLLVPVLFGCGNKKNYQSWKSAADENSPSKLVRRYCPEENKYMYTFLTPEGPVVYRMEKNADYAVRRVYRILCDAEKSAGGDHISHGHARLEIALMDKNHNQVIEGAEAEERRDFLENNY